MLIARFSVACEILEAKFLVVWFARFEGNPFDCRARFVFENRAFHRTQVFLRTSRHFFVYYGRTPNISSKPLSVFINFWVIFLAACTRTCLRGCDRLYRRLTGLNIFIFMKRATNASNISHPEPAASPREKIYAFAEGSSAQPRWKFA